MNVKVNKRNKIFSLLLILFVFGMQENTKAVKASGADPLGFSVEAIQPDTQIDKNKGYFYLLTEPDKTQEVKVKVKGTSEEPVKVKAYVANASTSEKGTIDYKLDTKNDQSLKSSIKEISQVEPSEFEIKKGEEKDVTVKVHSPSSPFEGIKLGTIYFERDNGEKRKAGSVISTYAYRVGLMITEKDQSYIDGKTLKLTAVSPELKRLKKTIQVTLQNPEPKIIEDFSMEVMIVNKKTGQVVKKQQLKDGRIAPNTSFDFSVDWGVDTMPTGHYIAKIDAKSRMEDWHLEKNFEITGAQAKKINDETVYKIKLPSWAYIITVIISLSVVILAVYLSSRHKKWRKKLKSKKKSTKSIHKKKK